MAFDFNELLPRRGTDSLKWDAPARADVLPLWVADMDFRAAPEIVEALRRRLESGLFGYTLVPPRWKEALTQWLWHRHGLRVGTESVIACSGVVPALAATVRAFCNPGDSVVIQPPVYNCFYDVIREQGCYVEENRLRRVPLPGGKEGDFTYRMDFGDLERKLADVRTKLLILSNPHNPAGRSWRVAELARVGELCRRHGVFVASDEIHGDLQMAGSAHVPFLSLGDGIGQVGASFHSASKAFNLAGLQAAAVVCPNEAARERIGRVLRLNRAAEPNLFGLVASEAAWRFCGGWLEELCAYIGGNWGVLEGFCHGVGLGLAVGRMESTYLGWVECSSLGVSSTELARRLEQEAGVKFSPGAIFGEAPGTAHLRVNLACPRARLEEALARTGAFLKREFGR